MNRGYQHYQTQTCSHLPEEKKECTSQMSSVKETNAKHMSINQTKTVCFKLIDRTLSESFERFNNGGVGLLPSTLLNL
jgi:hypothetical protein